MGIKLIRTLALMALAVLFSFGVLTDAEAGTCRKAGKVWDAKANKCQNIPTTLAPAAAASAPAVAPAPAPAASQPAAVPKTEKVTGVCGPAARQYPYEATGFEGQYCQVGKPSSPHIPFPVAGSTSRWSCVPDGGEAKACEATRTEKTAAALPVPPVRLATIDRMSIISPLPGIESNISVPGLPTLVVPICNGVVAVGGIPGFNFRSSPTGQFRPIGGQRPN